MKSTLSKCCETPAKSFPKLMINDNRRCIVLMAGINANGFGFGVVVHGTSYLGKTVGTYGTDFGMHTYSDYEGSVTLEN